MRFYCDHCEAFIEIDNFKPQSRMGELPMKGIVIRAQEEYAVCPVCGSDVFTNDMVNRNTHSFHNAYRLTIGSITTGEIQEILDMYNIGAQPLSLLLGWGPNTIERQMKHTIPDREHARRLRDLKNPLVMKQLLNSNRDRISDVAYRKALAAVEQLISREWISIAGMPKVEAGAHFRLLARSFSIMASAYLEQSSSSEEKQIHRHFVTFSDAEQHQLEQYRLAFSRR